MVMMCIGCIAANAQTTFTQRLQQSTYGEGKITVTHDKAIDDLVNGKPETSDTPKPEDKPTVKKTDSQKTREKLAQILEGNQAPNSTPDSTLNDGRKKVMRGIKITGYRVQAFAGGNQRKDRMKAEHIGATIKASYPTEPIYVHFYSPRWICRVGNYRTYEEAHEMLMNIRKLGISGASIVKGKITVQY